jgi:hypothetical protein
MELKEALARVTEIRTEEVCYKHFIVCTAIHGIQVVPVKALLSLTHLEARTVEAVSNLPQLLANTLPVLAGSVVSWHNWRLIITTADSAASWASWRRARRSAAI